MELTSDTLSHFKDKIRDLINDNHQGTECHVGIMEGIRLLKNNSKGGGTIVFLTDGECNDRQWMDLVKPKLNEIRVSPIAYG